MSEKRYFLCPNRCVAKTVIYPTPDREACPRLPEHSLCDTCGAVMLELDPASRDQRTGGMLPFKIQPRRPHEEG
jgi:hypothetical protein